MDLGRHRRDLFTDEPEWMTFKNSEGMTFKVVRKAAEPLRNVELTSRLL